MNLRHHAAMLLSGRRRGAAVLAVAVLSLALLAGCGSGGKKAATETPTDTPEATPTGANAGLKTPIPITPGSQLVQQDLDARGVGLPGRGPFNGSRLVIPKIGVDAPFSIKSVPPDGQMPNPNGPEDVAWYDFSGFPALGGVPGGGGNVVIAGHIDYIRYGPAVFWRLRELEAGDTIEIKMNDGSTATYVVAFNKTINVADAENTPIFENVVKATEGESLTAITCAGVFASGEYDARQVLWARRVT